MISGDSAIEISQLSVKKNTCSLADSEMFGPIFLSCSITLRVSGGSRKRVCC